MTKKLISHRGNLDKKNVFRENSPEYILEAIKYGFDVEIDVWLDDILFLGHDFPKYPIELSFLQNDKLWCHAKNLAALSFMIENHIHCFWHQQDDVTLTSKNYIWTYPGKNISNKFAIAVLPEEVENWNINQAYGICSDYIINFSSF